MLSVSVAPSSTLVTMNRLTTQQHECLFPQSHTTTLDDVGSSGCVSLNGSNLVDFSNTFIHEPDVLDSKVRPIVREPAVALDNSSNPSLATVDGGENTNKLNWMTTKTTPTTLTTTTTKALQYEQQPTERQQCQRYECPSLLSLTELLPAAPIGSADEPKKQPQQQQHHHHATLSITVEKPSLPLRRSTSLPSLGFKEVNVSSRRSIFGNYWDKKSQVTEAASATAEVPQHRRGIPIAPSVGSSPVTTDIGASAEEGIAWHHFSPPPSTGPIRHVPLLNIPQPSPPPPRPLRTRTNSEGWSSNNVKRVSSKPQGLVPTAIVKVPATTGGAYPLCSPRSILRHKIVTRNTSDPTHTLRFFDEEERHHHHRRDSSESSSELPFALTKSIKQIQRKQQVLEQDDDDDDDSDDTRSQASFSSSARSTTRRVQFNPIVLVTEFEEAAKQEHHNKGQWFSDRELSRFQHDAISKARAYLQTRPRVAEEYNQLKLCPVTGAMRKKALFSLPALSSIVEDLLPKVFSSDFQKLSEREIRTILIVEPNTMVRDLFCRCLHSMFPWARILGAPSGEEALKVMEGGLMMRNRSNSTTDIGVGGNSSSVPVDIVLVSEKLSRCRTQQSSLSSNPSTATTNSRTMCGDDQASESPPHDALPITMTSYELIRRICSLDHGVNGVENNKVKNVRTRPPLLIAVALNLTQDVAEQLEGSGADMVWGIPPPTPCSTLRNQLVYTIVAKRRFNKDEDVLMSTA